jgi:hypothetical protein
MKPNPDPGAIPGNDADIVDEAGLDRLLSLPLLTVPDDFTAKVMAALPVRAEPQSQWPTLSRAAGIARNLVLAVFGAAGTVEVLLFVSSLWTATAAAIP